MQLLCCMRNSSTFDDKVEDVGEWNAKGNDGITINYATTKRREGKEAPLDAIPSYISLKDLLSSEALHRIKNGQCSESGHIFFSSWLLHSTFSRETRRWWRRKKERRRDMLRSLRRDEQSLFNLMLVISCIRKREGLKRVVEVKIKSKYLIDEKWNLNSEVFCTLKLQNIKLRFEKI